MSWIERANNNITIITGDGNEWTPDYVIGRKSFDFNFAEFNFPNVRGSKVDRREPIGRRFELEIMFQGEFNVEIADNFEISSWDKRAWTVSHPFYGEILCHPTSLRFDSSKYNVTTITASVIETIEEDYPKSVENVESKAQSYFEEFADESDAQFENVQLEASDVNELANNNSEYYSVASDQITEQNAFNEYFNFFNEATTAILNATNAPLLAISKARAVITAPARLNERVRNRLDLLVEQFDFISVRANSAETPNEKLIYENQAGNIISAMVFTAVTPLEGDYNNADDVLEISQSIINIYNQHIINLDGLQTPTNDLIDSYSPSFTALNSLSESVYFMSSQLLQIALNAQQKRTFILTEDSDIINLTHRFYGLDANDVNMNEFIENNKIGLNEMFEIKKNREIIYYV